MRERELGNPDENIAKVVIFQVQALHRSRIGRVDPRVVERIFTDHVSWGTRRDLALDLREEFALTRGLHRYTLLKGNEGQSQGAERERAVKDKFYGASDV